VAQSNKLPPVSAEHRQKSLRTMTGAVSEPLQRRLAHQVIDALWLPEQLGN
jgi:hypothetical protein